MARAQHQPSEERVLRPKRESGEFLSVCGQTVAVVLALDESTTPLVVQYDEADREPVVCAPANGALPVPRPVQEFEGMPAVCHVVDACCTAQMRDVFVVTTPALSDAASRAIYSAKRKKNGPNVQIVAVEEYALVDRTREAANFKMFDLSFGEIELARGLAGTEFDGYDNVVIVSADNVRVTADHIYELCLDALDHPEADAIASWISWLRRPPYLFTRAFLDSIEERGLTSPGANGRDRDVPRINVRDHVFGEEKLAANPSQRPRVESFLAGCTISALEAVQLAKKAIAHPDEPLYSPHQAQSLMGPAKPKPLGVPDQMLVDIARDVLEARESFGDQEGLAWADAFGARCKLDFPLLNDRAHAGKLAYLDTAATSQRLDAALQAQRDFDVHENANVYRGGYELSARSTFTFNDARATLEAFIGAKRRQTVYTQNTTGAANLVAQAWGEWNIEEGDVIVVELAAHHSNMLPFMMLAQRKGAHVEYVPYRADGRIDLDAYHRALEMRPKLVCLAHVGNVFGIEAPVSDMAEAAHAAGARVFLDAAQSFAHEKLDVNALGVDWLAISAHKAYGPMGIGALWISDDAFAEMDPLGGGGGTVSHVGVDSYYLRPKTIQYEMGTPPVSQAVGWAAAIDYLEAIGMENVARHDAVLTRYLIDGLHRIEGVDVMGDHSGTDGETGLVSFTLRSLVPASLASFAGKLGVAVRSGGHCALPLHAHMGLIGTGRVSLGVYTTLDDVDAALVAIDACRYVNEMK